jgi:hypothetical protein
VPVSHTAKLELSFFNSWLIPALPAIIFFQPEECELNAEPQLGYHLPGGFIDQLNPCLMHQKRTVFAKNELC